MFFDCILLNPQHRGVFGEVWLAATRGVNCLTKTRILGVDVVKVCASLEKFIQSDSGTSKKRFSLRLSSLLISGTIRIFKQQTILLQTEIFAVLEQIHLPAGGRITIRRLSRDLETPPTPKPRVKSKKTTKRPVVETPPEQIEAFVEPVIQLPALEDIFRPTAASDQITLREQIGTRLERLDEEYPLGILTDKELEELDTLIPSAAAKPAPRIARSPSTPDVGPSVHTIEVVAQVHAPAGDFTEIPVSSQIAPIEEPSAPSVVPEPSRVPTIEEPTAPTLISEPSRIPPTEEPPAPEIIPEPSRVPATIEEPGAPTEPSAPTLISEAVERRQATKKTKKRSPVTKVLGEIQEVVDRPRLTIEDSSLGITRKPVSSEYDRLFLIRRKKAFVRINRCLENQNEYVDKECPLPGPFRKPDNSSLYDLFWDDEIAPGFLPRPDSSSLRPSSIRESGSQPLVGRAARSTLERVSTPRVVTPQLEKEISRFPSEGTPIAPSLLSVERVRLSMASPTRRPTSEIEHVPVTTIEPMEVEEQIAVPTLPIEQVQIEQVPIEQVPIEHVPAEQVPTEQVPTEQVPMETESIPSQLSVPMESRTEIPEDIRLKVTLGLDYKIRQQRIIDIVALWDFTKNILKIEHLCEKPYTRLLMASVFSDLLTLCANKFIILKNKEESLELKSIEKGPKFN